MKIPPPDFALISSHKREVEAWENHIINLLKDKIKSGYSLPPQAYTFGYSYYEKQYQAAEFILDSQMLTNPNTKLEGYKFLKNIEKHSPFQVIAFIFVTQGFVKYTFETDIWTPVVYISVQTKISNVVHTYAIDEGTDMETGERYRQLIHTTTVNITNVRDEMATFGTCYSMDFCAN